MDNSPMYILVHSLDELSNEEPVTAFSSLEWGKTEARKRVESGRPDQTIYKLVPVYGVKLKVTYEVVNIALP